MTQTDEMLRPARVQPAGIGGWLFVPLVLLVLTCGAGLIAAFVVLPDVLDSQYAFHGIAGGLLLVACVMCLVRFANRKRETRLMMIGLCAALIAFLAVLYLFPPHLLRGGPAIVAAATLVYFLRSKRVKNTFVR